jgi:hypothetical protein
MGMEIKDNFERIKVVEEPYKHEMNIFYRTRIRLAYNEGYEGNV